MELPTGNLIKKHELKMERLVQIAQNLFPTRKDAHLFALIAKTSKKVQTAFFTIARSGVPFASTPGRYLLRTLDTMSMENMILIAQVAVKFLPLQHLLALATKVQN